MRIDLTLSAASQFIYKVLGYVILALLARYLTKAEFGEFLFAASLAGMFVLFTEFGTSNHLIRETGADPDLASLRFSEVFAARLPLLATYLLAVNAFALVFKPDLLVVIAITSVYVGLKDLYRACAAVLLGVGRVGLTIAVYGSGLLLLVGLVLVVIRRDGGLIEVLVAYCVWTAYIVLAGLAVVWRVVGRPSWSRGSRESRSVLRKAFPLFLLAALTLLHFKVDTVMLGFMRSYSEVATYEAAAKLLEASQFLVRPLWMIFLPICAALVGGRQVPRLKALLRKLSFGSAALGLAVAIPVIAAAAWIIPQVFGTGFENSAPILRVLYMSVPALFVATVATFVAVALHLERAGVRIMMFSVVLNIALNAALIPTWGALGAAWTTLVTQTLVAVWMVGLDVRAMGRLEADSAT